MHDGGQLLEIELIDSGIRELLKDGGIAGMCDEAAYRKAAELGPGYEVETFDAATRHVARVIAKSQKAHYDNLDNNSLLKAFGGNIFG